MTHHRSGAGPDHSRGSPAAGSQRYATSHIDISSGEHITVVVLDHSLTPGIHELEVTVEFLGLAKLRRAGATVCSRSLAQHRSGISRPLQSICNPLFSRVYLPVYLAPV